MKECTTEFQRGAEAMRAACIVIVEPLGTYSDTVEMQTILRIRSELERLIRAIDLTPAWVNVYDYLRRE